MKLSILSNVFVGKHLESDYDFFWADVATILKKQNLRLLNPQQQVMKQLIEKTENAVQVIKAGNIDLVNLADNALIHDNSKVPLAMNRANIHTVGIGMQQTQARKPFICKIKDITVGIIGFTCKEEQAHDIQDAPTIFYTPFGDINPIKQLLHETKEEVDILIALVQWGSERPEPNNMYQQFAHALIDEGVDIIHGESGHVYLGVENYNGKLIIYDSGDFVDIYMSNEKQNVPRSFIYEIEVEKRAIHKATLVPVLLQENQLKKAIAENKTEAIGLMQNISKNLGTTISDNGEIEL
jgi:poly-gamma-glutamate synthesis protein (capsule biosynthesis protein)